jgi:hypothetical protein
LTKVRNGKGEKSEWRRIQEMESRNKLVNKLEESQFVEVANEYNVRP